MYNRTDRITLDWNDVLGPGTQQMQMSTDTHASSCMAKTRIEDALILSLNNANEVNIDYIAGITDSDPDEVIEALQGIIFQNPETWDENPVKGWETRDEYLSGNLKIKHRVAKEAQQKYGRFQHNIEALENLMPEDLREGDIYVTLGSPWVPTHVIDDFISYLFMPLVRHNTKIYCIDSNKVKHDNFAWEIPNKQRFGFNTLSVKTYGTNRIHALHLLEMTLNMKTAVVYDEVPSFVNNSGCANILNEAETLMALEKQKLLIKAFQEWVWKDKERTEELRAIYENKYACIKQRIYDGSYLTFPGMNPDIQLYSYQKNAVARILTSPNTLLAHEVGAGKTYVMAAAGMKLRSLGLSKKNMYVVPNSIVSQWREIFLEVFPKAKIICVEPGRFKPSVRQKILAEIRDNEYDAVIIAYSCFDLIPLSRNWYRSELEEEKKTLEALTKNKRKSTKAMKARLKKVTKTLGELVVSSSGTDMICFDELGVTRLFVDEAHNFKNIPLYSHGSFMNKTFSGGSKKCQHMLDKVHHIQSRMKGGGVVMATGTPITNSISEIYVMQQYLQSGQLALLDLQTVDRWVGMFAERSTEFEIDVDTNSYKLATRLSKVHNIPELTDMIASFTDFHKTDIADGIPTLDGYINVTVQKSPQLEEYLKYISSRTEIIRKKKIRRRDDNLLKITTDGRKAAIDMRLIDPKMLPSKSSKVKVCAENIFRVYEASGDTSGTQLVFCDISTPKNGFNLYDALKDELLYKGIPEEEIAYIHDAKSEIARERIFQKMREGTLRVLIGSTAKLGLGVNVQDHLIALHHLDVPWRPADMTQREGRILRKGNQNSKVKIFRYVTSGGSFDAYSWQLLERKQRFVNDILSGTALSRTAEDDSQDMVLSYAEVKALAIGNPKLKERIDTANELYRFRSLQRKHIESNKDLMNKLAEIRTLIEKNRSDLENIVCDIELYEEWKADQPDKLTGKEKTVMKKQRQKLRQKLTTALRKNVQKSIETMFNQYKGFVLILPSHMKEEDPYIILEGFGRYIISIHNNDKDPLPYIDGFIANLYKRKENYKERVEKRQIEMTLMENELNTHNYADEIKRLTKKLEMINKELGLSTEE